MLRFLVGLFALVLSAQVIVVRHRGAPEGEPWLEGYRYRKEIVIPAGAVTADLTDFPVFVPLAGDTDLAAHARKDGSDIAFTASDGTTVLPFEIVNSNPGMAAMSGAWNWITGPIALRVLGQKDQVVFSYTTDKGYVFAASYNNETKETVAFDLFEIHIQQDDHTQAAWLELRSGEGGSVKHLAAFYQHHNGLAHYRVTEIPEDIKSLGPPKDWTSTTLPGDTGHAYAAPFQMADGSIWVFFRSFPSQRWAAAKSDSETTLRANTWSTVIDVAVTSDASYNYMRATQSADRQWIYIAMVDSHPNDRDNNLYCAKFDGTNLYALDGTLIGPISGAPYQLSTWTKVWDHMEDGVAEYGVVTRCWIYDIALDENGNPVIAYTTYPGASRYYDPDHRYRYAVWDGSAFVDHEITAAGGRMGTMQNSAFYSGGLCLDQANPSIVYLARNNETPNFVLEKWVTADSGATWTVTPIRSDGDNYRPVVAWGPPGDGPRLFWMRGSYTGYTDYRTSVEAYPVPERLSWLTEAHVLIPQISASQPTKFYMYYGHENPTVIQDKVSLWSAYSIVAHLSETDLGMYVKDSTEPAWTERRGVKARPAQVLLETDAKVGRGLAWTGNSRVELPFPALDIAGDTVFTQMGWVKTSGPGSSGMIASNADGTQRGYFFTRINASSKKLECSIRLSDGSVALSTFDNPPGVDIADGEWHHYAIQYNSTDGSGLKAWIDGQQSPTVQPVDKALHSTASTHLQLGYSVHNAVAWNGVLDEWRYARDLLPVAHILATYWNQRSPATFLQMGAEEVQ